MKKREILAKANSAQNWEKVETLIKLLVDSGRIEKQDFYNTYYYQDLTDDLMFIYYSADSVVFVNRDKETNTFIDFMVKHRDYKLNKAIDR
jgi:hypothetical protein|nr:MAG TPA: hypothetical protein [Caudoviricetes sp.]